MAKVWFIKGSGRYYKSEREFLKAIRDVDNRTFIIYEQVETGSCGNYKRGLLKERERDIQLRSVLGELTKYEESISNFMKLFSELAKEETTKQRIIKYLKDANLDKKAISNILVKNKKYFISGVSTDVNWYVSLLKCHNFINYKYPNRLWDSISRKYVDVPENQIIIDNFLEAKKLLRK